MVARAPAQPAQGEDVWHVAVAPGEVKLLTVEQLDDLFRLEIIDGSTKVWKPGMGDWVPLSVMAGLDDDDDPAPAAPARPLGQTAPMPVSRPTAPWHPAAGAPVPPSARGPSVAPKPSTSPFTAGNYAPPAAALPTPAAIPGVPPSDVYAVSSQPLAVKPVKPAKPKRAPRPAGSGNALENTLVGLAVVVGLLVTLQRNDVVRVLAARAGFESAYLRFEKAVGGPGFGTPRSIELLRRSSAGNTASAVDPARPDPTDPRLPARAPARSAPVPTAAPAGKEAPAPAAPPAAERGTGAAAPKSAPAPQPASPAADKKKSSANKGIRKYDPLNPAL